MQNTPSPQEKSGKPKMPPAAAPDAPPPAAASASVPAPAPTAASSRPVFDSASASTPIPAPGTIATPTATANGSDGPAQAARAPARQYVSRRVSHSGPGNRIAMALGWFSVGLGLAQLLAPRRVSQAIGVTPQSAGMRALGARELALGVGMLASRRQSTWAWGRVAADAMDIGLLGAATRNALPGSRSRLGLATAAVAGIAVLDIVTSLQQTRRESRTGNQGAASGGVDVEKSISINCSPQECYQFWRNFENLPRFMEHLESVTNLSDRRSHWKATGPGGTTVEWDADLTVDQPGKLLAWRSVDNASVDSAGTVSFEPAAGGRGTILRIEMQYQPPGGKPAAMLAKLSGRAPAQMIGEELRRFKWLIETGVIPSTAGQPSGPRSVMARMFKQGEPV